MRVDVLFFLYDEQAVFRLARHRTFPELSIHNLMINSKILIHTRIARNKIEVFSLTAADV